MWFITAIYFVKPKNPSPARAETQRTFGYYLSDVDAIEAIKENRSNMHENLYNFLVLEEIGEGVHPEVKNEEWYQWSEWEKKWMPCFKPTQLVGIVNWAVG